GVPLVEVGDLVHAGDAHRLQVVGQVVALPRFGRLGELEAAGELVAAVLGDEVHVQAAGDGFGSAAGRLVDGLLDHRFVVIRLDCAVAHRAVGDQAVDGHHRAGRADAVDREIGLLHGPAAADVR